MPARPEAAAAAQTREERIEAVMKELRPKIEATVQRMVERAVDVPEAEEFGAIDFEFRDAGLGLANEVRQASVASRKKGVRRLQRDVRALLVRRQIPLVPAASARDDSWGRLDATGLLLLRPVSAGLPALRRGVGPDG